MMTVPILRLELLGGCTLRLGEERLTAFKSRKTEALLVYVICTGRLHDRNDLAQFLWPDSDPGQARANLRKTISELNKVVGSHFDISRTTIAPSPDTPYWIDRDELRAALDLLPSDNQTLSNSDVEQLETAVGLYHGGFLDGFYLRDSYEFENWALLERERWQQQIIVVLNRLINYHLHRRNYNEGIQYADRLLQIDPLREEAHRLKMRLLARAGDRNAALAQFATCRDILQAELGVLPTEATQQLYERIRHAHTKPRRAFGTPYFTSFVGREAELATISEWLDNPDRPLLTLVGPGGSGKSRLANEVVNQVLALPPLDFPDGVYYIPLAQLEANTTTGTLATTIASYMHLSLTDLSPQQQLIAYLRAKKLLLVLDNVEQLQTSLRLLTQIIQTAPQVKILATSRIRLNLPQEMTLDVFGLPPTNRAVQLFADRASRARPGFVLNADNKAAIQQVCALVDGLPLAVELAAAATRAFAPEQIVAELSRNLDFLTTTLRDVPARHRSLRAVFAQSWQLLSAQEQAVFQRLSVLRGVFTAEWARVVADTSLGTLRVLVDKSLVQVVEETGRFALHPLLRQYAAEKLATDPTAQTNAQQRLTTYFAQLLVTEAARLNSAEQKESLNAIEAALENILSSWQWAAANNQSDPIHQGLPALFLFFEMRGRFLEGQEVFAQALANSVTAPPLLRARLQAGYGWFTLRVSQHEAAINALQASRQLAQSLSDDTTRNRVIAFADLGLGKIQFNQGDYATATDHLNQALSRYQQIGDEYGTAQTLGILGDVTERQSDYATAKTYLEQALAIHETSGNQWAQAGVLHNLGVIADLMGDEDIAQQRYLACLETHRQLENNWGEAKALNNLGVIAYNQQDFHTARAYYEASMEIYREVGDLSNVAMALNNLGLVAHDLGELSEAERLYQESWGWCRRINDLFNMGLVLNNLGILAMEWNQTDRAMQYFEQTLAVCEETGDRWGVANVHNNLADVARKAGNDELALTHYRQAMRTALDIMAQVLLLDAVMGLAMLNVAAGDMDKAQPLALAVKTHELATEQQQEKIEQWQESAGLELPDPPADPDSYLLTVVRQILAE